MTRSPAVRGTGTDSPVMRDSSTLLVPEMMTPSTGMRSPGRTTTVSPGDEGCDGSFDLDAVADYMCGLRLQSGEGVESVEGAACGARLEPIAEQQEAKDKQHGVVVDVGMQAVLREEAGEEGRGYRIEEGGAGAERDQRVHGRGAVQRSLQSALVDDSACPDHADEGDAEHDVFERGSGNAIERWKDPNEQAVEHAGAVHERHRQQHGQRATGDGGDGFDPNQALLSGIGLMHVIVLVDHRSSRS